MVKNLFKNILFRNENNIAQKKLQNNEINEKWFRLDNAAKLYPVIMKRSYVSVFRISAIMNENIDPDILQDSLDFIITRFPYYNVKLRKGFFWYYFEKNKNRLLVEPDVKNPCKTMNRKENNGFLIRIRYYKKRIAVEFFHGLTDASGTLIFLETLIARYLFFKEKIVIPAQNGVLDCLSKPSIEEFEDSYNKYANFKVIRRARQENSYKIKGTDEPIHTLHIITGIVPLSELKTITKRYGVSITEYLASVFIYSIYMHQQSIKNRDSEKPIQISVPVNMRNHYPSKTMRNFSLFVSPGIEPAYGTYTFEEILEHVHHYMRYELSSKYMNALMCANVSSEKNVLIKAVPLFIKNIGMLLGYQKFGILKYSATLSNLGIVIVPDEMKKQVGRFDLVIGPCKYNPINIGLVSYNDKINITFSSTIVEKDIERMFFRHLVKSGIPVKIETNEE